MKKLLLIPLILFALISCNQQKKADVIVINSNAYTVNSNFDKAEAFAIKNGKFIAVGTTKDIQKGYKSDKINILLQDIEKGVYFLKLIAEDGSLVLEQKFIKQ